MKFTFGKPILVSLTPILMAIIFFSSFKGSYLHSARLTPLRKQGAADKEFKLLFKIPLKGGSFTTDNLLNLYIYRGTNLKKYNSSGTLQFNYDDKSFGNITYLDVNDPLKVLVFYKDFPEIVFLDNTLSRNGAPISPANAGFPLATLACISHDNGLWLYDSQVLQLVRFDANLTVTVKTGNIVPLIGSSINPIEMMEYNSFLYLNDTAKGLFIFDQFGAYSRTIPLTGLTTFEIRGDDVFFVKNNMVHIFHVKSDSESFTPLLVPASTARVEKSVLFESSRDTVYAYQIK